MLVLCLFIEGLYSCLTDQFPEMRQNALKLFRKFILSTCCVSGMLDIVAHYSYFDSNIPGERWVLIYGRQCETTYSFAMTKVIEVS